MTNFTLSWFEHEKSFITRGQIRYHILRVDCLLRPFHLINKVCSEIEYKQIILLSGLRSDAYCLILVTSWASCDRTFRRCCSIFVSFGSHQISPQVTYTSWSRFNVFNEKCSFPFSSKSLLPANGRFSRLVQWSKNLNNMTGNECVKFQTIQLILTFCLQFRGRLYAVFFPKLFGGIANSEDPNQTLKKQSDLGLHCAYAVLVRKVKYEITINRRVALHKHEQ